jgi:hypothetical protein
MKLLSDHIIPGAAHDSSERDPPPRCHPQTRVRVIARITAWFDGQAQQELLLWITGPAGAGKSAVVQTFAEYLANSRLLGASVFISRPNKRNNSRGIFVTIAYQLAIRIDGYRHFVTELLSRDPELLNDDIASQFEAFIVEPFVKKRIGAYGGRWGVLLDGLDELEGEDAQCIIIQLISSFAHEHRDAGLIWIISSRPEPHISNTFNDDAVRRSCWSEVLPIDSIETSDDVECFLRSSFETMRNRFPQSIPSDWPSESAFLALTTAISGLFIYAEVAMQFIRDPDYADPVSRLEVLLSIIDASPDVSTGDNPFVQLDALYHEFLSLIPARLWSATKQLLGFVIHQQEILHSLGDFNTLRGMAILFGLTPHVIYPCLLKCHSTLRIPDWNVAHKETLVFLHASFAYFLKDSSRSRGFYVGSTEDVEGNITLRLFKIWNECSGDDITTGEYDLLVPLTKIDVILASASVVSTWHRRCSKLDDKTQSGVVVRYHANLFRNVVGCLVSMVCRTLGKPVDSPIHAQLIEIHMIKLCYYLNAEDVQRFVWHLTVNTQFLTSLEYDCFRRQPMSIINNFSGRLGSKTSSSDTLTGKRCARLAQTMGEVFNFPKSG